MLQMILVGLILIEAKGKTQQSRLDYNLKMLKIYLRPEIRIDYYYSFILKLRKNHTITYRSQPCFISI